MAWNIDKSADLYGIDKWGSGYFKINDSGNISVQPGTDTGAVDLSVLVSDLVARGVRSPILLRFSDLLKARIELISNCFAKAINEYGYQGRYSGVYPIKVNQQRHVLEELVGFGREHRLGLECGSKPELLIALAFMDTPDSYIVCNGFKDPDYIETALLSQKLGRNTIIVVDRMDEIQMIIKEAQQHKIKPRIGFRSKLNAQGVGKWMESSGAHSKFGLTPSEIVRGIEILKQNDMLSSLELLHFHIGSQIPSIHAIKSSVKEAARLFTEIYKLGAPLKFLDVGGGLGIDYDGSGHGDSSTNYSEQEYANDVVTIIQSICDEKSVPHPDIISESGRAIVAHSSVLVFDVLGHNPMERDRVLFKASSDDTTLVKDLFYIYENVNKSNINEYYNDLIEKKSDTDQLFSLGGINLDQRAKAEDLYWAIATKITKLAKNDEDAEDIYWNLINVLSDTYYCNFSIFQSLPDSWAVGQLFPVMPIQRLHEKPERRATLVDITCDSDGKIEKFIDTETDESQGFLEVHELRDHEPYYLGVFLTGAYQETLGDLHNLFGDTDAVHVSINKDGYQIDHMVKGDSVEEVLGYVEYNKSELIERIRKTSETSILRGDLSHQEAKTLMRNFEQGLAGYTYLDTFLEEPE